MKFGDIKGIAILKVSQKFFQKIDLKQGTYGRLCGIVGPACYLYGETLKMKIFL